MAVLDRFRLMTQEQQPVTGETTSAMPLIDTADTMGSLATLLGPTPAEREARQRKMEQSRAKMAMWTGVFDGLRQLGNLYYTYKGARPQQFSDPYAQVDKMYQEGMQRADDIDTYRRQYAQQLYALRRQAGEDRRKNMLTMAQANYYDTRDQMALLKAENDRLKAEAAVRNTNARTANTEAKTETENALRTPRQQEIQSRTAKNNRTGGGIGKSGGSGKPYNEHYVTTGIDPKTGNQVKQYVAGRYGENNNKQPYKTVQKKPSKPNKPTNNSGFFNK